MKRNLLITFIWIFASCGVIFSQTGIQGTINDNEGLPAIGAEIVIYKGGIKTNDGAITDANGYFSISPLDPGTYDVEVSAIGLQTKRSTVLISSGSFTEFKVDLETFQSAEVIITEYKDPLVKQDETTQGRNLTAEQIAKLPTRDVSSIAATTAGVGQVDEGSPLTFKGSRPNATFYYLDGVRISGTPPVQTEIEQLSVVTGGVEAQYGDLTGGFISITSKGPSSKLSGGVEVETSEGLDAFGSNLVNANLTGPILKKGGKTVLGFRLAGQYQSRRDDDPSAVGVFAVKDDVRARLEANPLVRNPDGSIINSADFLTRNDVQRLKAQPNELAVRRDLSAKIDAKLSDAMDLSITGTFNDIVDRFTPTGQVVSTDPANATWRLLNTSNNPNNNTQVYRGIFRFRHRLGSQGKSGAQPSNSFIRNASYSLIASYERFANQTFDHRHGDRVFDYGYIGSFNQTWGPREGIDPLTGEQFFTISNPVLDPSLTNYGSQNPILANYNNILGGSDLTQLGTYINVNGQLNSAFAAANGFHTGVGTVYNRFRKRENDQLTFRGDINFDLVPNKSKSDKNRHSIQMGFQYEQRTLRSYSMNPIALWQLARTSSNNHILTTPNTNEILGDLNGVPIYANEIIAPGDFARNVRTGTTTRIDEFYNVDNLRPDQLNLGMFNPDQLTSDPAVNLNYYGFDYKGNRLSSGGGFYDFFRDPNRNVGALSPTYTSFYIQDKFKFEKMFLRFGVRYERFDANTQVLRDQYSLYPIETAADYFNKTPGTVRPGAVQGDWKVYKGNEGNQPYAFRSGNNWYNSQGEVVNNPNDLFAQTLLNPVISDNTPISSDKFDARKSFQDYKPQVNIVPRISFSFPISEEANFFAHYDVLVQRPPADDAGFSTFNDATSLDYLYANRAGSWPLSNPNLLPEKTIDYEVGFQQALNKTSSLKVAAFYKELRDMIQRRTLLYVWNGAPAEYDTYDNIDFGTVKGFTFSYDLRRTKNLTFIANYTLQFANGTGNDPNSQRGLTRNGNLRTLFPMSFDERHNFSFNVDYRYGSGKEYNGPEVFGIKLFENTGVNFQNFLASGRPYTRRLVPERFNGSVAQGNFGSARLPWRFTINMRLDKTIKLNPKAKKPLEANVFLRVQNLLNAKNVLNVYTASGSPDSDGFLQSFRGSGDLQSAQQRGLTVEQFTDSYNWRMLQPDFWAQPRRVFLGMTFNF
jgi:hypothetical protein